jgi:type I restriction enzyme S subunit
MRGGSVHTIRAAAEVQLLGERLMAVWSEVSTSDLVGAIRLDAEFWQPAYMEKERAICAGNHKSLGTLVSTFKKGIFYILAREYADQGIPFYRSSNVGAILPKDEALAFITPAKNNAEFKTSLETGDLMIVKTGRSGASVVLAPCCNVSQDVIAVKVRRERVNPYFLAVYLNTAFGFSEMNRWFQGQVQPHLSLEDARRIRVGLASDEDQLEVETLVKGAARSRSESEAAHRHAKELLDVEFGFDKLTFQRPMGYTTRFSDLETSRRSDAEFYNPELRFCWRELSKTFELRRLTEFANVAKFANPDYGDSGVPIVTQKHLRNISPVGYGNELRTTTGWRQANPSATLRENDLLFYSVGAYLGKTNIWLNEDEAVPASFITLLRCNEEHDAGFMHVLLNSRYGLLQSKTYQSGTSQQYIYPKDIKRFLVPNVRQEVREQVHSLVLESFAKETESEKLLEQAKARVEQLIEEAAHP